MRRAIKLKIGRDAKKSRVLAADSTQRPVVSGHRLHEATVERMPRRRNETVIFKTGNSLAVRLVEDCKLPRGTIVREYRDGNRIILEPVDEWPPEFSALAGSWTEDIPRPAWDEARDPFT